MADAVRVATPAHAPVRPRPDITLTQRASLNVIASLLDYGAKVAVGFLVIPIVVAGLGSSLYGVWEMLARLTGYLTSSNWAFGRQVGPATAYKSEPSPTPR